jgi:hypothetical protein
MKMFWGVWKEKIISALIGMAVMGIISGFTIIKVWGGTPEKVKKLEEIKADTSYVDAKIEKVKTDCDRKIDVFTEHAENTEKNIEEIRKDIRLILNKL